MSDPETMRRIEGLSRAEVALGIAKNAIEFAMTEINYVVPRDHQLAKTLADARLAFAKTDVLNSQLLARFKR